MKILFLTYYFEPDLCAGSFRNSSLFKELLNKMNDTDTIKVISTHPNRYDSYKIDSQDFQNINGNATIHRVKIPNHNNSLFGQIKSFTTYYRRVHKLIKEDSYDLIYASSSRLFTAFLGAKIARRRQAKLYLDIRDIFRESVLEIIKNPFIKIGLNIFLKRAEKYTFKKATHINLVSKGFKSYFKNYKNCSYSFFMNGIDDVFLGLNSKKERTIAQKRTIVYAGNIGEGQGLHHIIPQAAIELGEMYEFLIFGDGGTKTNLLNKIKELGASNVKVFNPINRKLLIEEYQKASFLFLHLNSYKAFERVLPSKLFEYGAFDKPIIAGVGGYAASFLKEYMDNIILFSPRDVKTFVEKIKGYTYTTQERVEFKAQFSRKNINKEMANSIISMVK